MRETLIVFTRVGSILLQANAKKQDTAEIPCWTSRKMEATRNHGYPAENHQTPNEDRKTEP
jgi:hypothetical protein